MGKDIGDYRNPEDCLSHGIESPDENISIPSSTKTPVRSSYRWIPKKYDKKKLRITIHPDKAGHASIIVRDKKVMIIVAGWNRE